MISVCAIARNEEKTIADWVSSLTDYVEEIILIDNGSLDNTAGIARDLGCKVIHCTDSELDRCRNLSFQHATEPWILILDLDEYIGPKDMVTLRDIARTDNDNAVYPLIRYDYLGNRHFSTTYFNRFLRYNENIGYNDSPIHATLTDSINRQGYIRKTCSAVIQHLDYKYREGISYYQKKNRYIQLIKQQLTLVDKGNYYSNWLSLLLGLEYYAINQTALAKEHILDALEKNRDHLLTIFCLAKLEIIQDDFSKTEYFIQRLLLSNDKLLKDKAYLLQAQSAIRFGQVSQAIDAIHTAIKASPELAHNYLNMAQVLKRTHDAQTSEFFRQACILNPMIEDADIVKKWDFNTSCSLQDVVLDI